jgi:hypothetical protein
VAIWSLALPVKVLASRCSRPVRFWSSPRPPTSFRRSREPAGRAGWVVQPRQ